MRGIHGSWLIPGDGSPAVAGGGVVLDERERVVAVGELAALQRAQPSVRFESLPAVLMPGLVNAHTHLELSALRGLVAGGKGFVPWVDALMSIRAVRQPEADAESIEQGVSELLAAGVVAIGEVSNRLATVPLLAALPIAGCIFHEVFGMRRDTGEVTLGMAHEERTAFGAWPAQWRYSLAPHTTHTLHPAILREILARVRAAGGRSSLHLAEHAAERAFLERGGGPFPEWLKTRAASELDWQPPGCDPVRYAEQLGALGPDVIVVHLADARPDELALVAAAGSPVVLCPRSNLHIELKLPPLLDVLRAGLRPGLGTDSLASNASLDPLAEARALRQRFPTVAPATLLAMTSGWGADALGFGGKLGRLEVGAYPGVLAFEHGAVAPSEPERFILDNDRALRRVVSRPNYPALPPEVFA